MSDRNRDIELKHAARCGIRLVRVPRLSHRKPIVPRLAILEAVGAVTTNPGTLHTIDEICGIVRSVLTEESTDD